MKPVTLFVCTLSLIFLISGTVVSAEGEKKAKPLTEKESISYIIGTNIARSLVNIKDEIDFDTLIKGLKDKLEDKPLLISDAEGQAVMSAFSQKMKKKQEEKQAVEGKKNLEEGKKFLEANKSKEGILTTDSGLQYRVLKQGEGPKPVATDKVKVHYRGTTIDGKEFDSSYKRGNPASFGVSGVIKGWTEALLLMNTGSKYELFIPSEIAYGQRGAGPGIGPNAVLIFEVELLSIEK